MFLENAFIGRIEPLRYIGGTFIVIIAYFIASVPFGVAIVMELGAENVQTFVQEVEQQRL